MIEMLIQFNIKNFKSFKYKQVFGIKETQITAYGNNNNF